MKLPIDPLVMLVAFCVGFVLVYLRSKSTTPDVVYIYPTPDNAGKITYTDAAGVCYKYKMKKVKCVPGAKSIPLQ